MQLKELGLAIFDHDFKVFFNFFRSMSFKADDYVLLLKGLQMQIVLIQKH